MRIDARPRHKNAPRPAWKVCPFCEAHFARPSRISDAQWEMRKFCSYRCSKSLSAKEILARNFVRADGPLDTQCWLWTGRSNRAGYGRVAVKRHGKITHWFAHRLAYVEFCGDPGELLICHRCDVPACVNPDHLFAGTHLDNMRDMDSKGRRKAANGDQKPSSKLNSDAVRDILSGGSPTDLAKKYGVSVSSIYKVRQGVAWGWVNGQN